MSRGGRWLCCGPVPIGRNRCQEIDAWLGRSFLGKLVRQGQLEGGGCGAWKLTSPLFLIARRCLLGKFHHSPFEANSVQTSFLPNRVEHPNTCLNQVFTNSRMCCRLPASAILGTECYAHTGCGTIHLKNTCVQQQHVQQSWRATVYSEYTLVNEPTDGLSWSHTRSVLWSMLRSQWKYTVGACLTSKIARLGTGVAVGSVCGIGNGFGGSAGWGASG